MTGSLQFGRIVGEPIDRYHGSGCLSSTKLGDFISLGADYYRRRYITGEIKADDDTQSQLIGHSSHCLILEGERAYRETYAVLPPDAPAKPTQVMLNARNPSPESIARMNWWSQWDSENAGKCVLKAEDDATNRRMLKAVREHPIAWPIIMATQHEVTFRAKGQHFEVQCRFDMICDQCPEELAALLHANLDTGAELCVRPGLPFGADFKSTRSLPMFIRQFDDFGYYRQFAFYSGLLAENFDVQLEDFLCIACENCEPFHVGVFAVDSTAMAAGSREVITSVKKLIQCHETGIWEGSNPKVQRLGLRPWRLREITGATESGLE